MINKVGDSDVRAEYKIFVKNKPAIVLFYSGSSIPVISEKFYKQLPYAVMLLQHDNTAIINASGNSLGPVSQCYLTFKLSNKTFTDKFYILQTLE